MDIRFPVVLCFIILLGLLPILSFKRSSISHKLNVKSRHLKKQLMKNIDIKKTNWKYRIRFIGLFFLIMFIMIFYTHRENVKRLINKEESKTKIY